MYVCIHLSVCLSILKKKFPNPFYLLLGRFLLPQHPSAVIVRVTRGLARPAQSPHSARSVFLPAFPGRAGLSVAGLLHTGWPTPGSSPPQPRRHLPGCCLTVPVPTSVTTRVSAPCKVCFSVPHEPPGDWDCQSPVASQQRWPPAVLRNDCWVSRSR